MKQYNNELNTMALDVALEALFKTEGRDNAKRVYELLNASMANVYAAGAASRNDELAQDRQQLAEHITRLNAETKQTIQAAERIGFDKGHATAMFSQAVDKLNAEATAISPALAPQAPQAEASEETALVNAASALG